MRMAELSGASGVPVATIKYYLREGLLPAGERTGPNQARYGEEHVRRLRLVRALIEVGGLAVNQVSEVLKAMDADEYGPHKIFGVAQATVTHPGLDPDDDREPAQWARRRVAALIERHNWWVKTDSPAALALARALATLFELGEYDMLDQLDARAESVERVARLDLELVAAHEDIEAQVRTVVVGTVLGDVIMATLRRLAQVDASARRFGH